MSSADAKAVRIVADDDGPGLQHAQQVRESLALVGAEAPLYKPCGGKDVPAILDLGYSMTDPVEMQAGNDPQDDPDRDEGSKRAACFNEPGIVVPALAAAIAPADHIRLGVDGRLYHYDNGVYRPDGDAFVRARARQILGERFRRRHVDEAVAWFRSDPTTVTDQPSTNLLNLQNGLLHWKGSTLEPHTTDFVSVNQIPVKWKPEARCERIDRFLAEVLAMDSIDFIHEVIGYCLYAGNPQRVAVLLLGPGRNGKSVLLGLIRALLGKENVASVPLQLFSENRFTTAELFGRLANICGDLDARAIKRSDQFKMIVGGDPIYAERKNRDGFSFISYATPLFSANEPPLSSDQTQAWFDRWVIVPMENRIDSEKIDPHLLRKLTEPSELEGLLVHAVAGLQRLMKRGRFESPGSVQAAGDRYRERLDTVRGFVTEACELDLDAWTARKDLYPAYRGWIQDSGRHALGAQTFYDHLRRGFADEIREAKRHSGIRGFEGIRLLGGLT